MEVRISGSFYDFGTRTYRFEQPVKAGDVIKAVEFNTDTQVFDLIVERPE